MCHFNLVVEELLHLDCKSIAKKHALRGLDLGICQNKQFKPTFFKRDNLKNDHVRV